ncbi:hypothetical protein ACSBR1_006341 [Camellia fascicularis]
MNNLRPKVKRERHRITLSLGFLFGCSMALLIALILVIHTRNIINQKGYDQYMDTLFPLIGKLKLSQMILFGFITLHMHMYTRNIYYWRRYRVKYSFIFGFKEGAEMRYIEVLLLSFGVALLALASVHANLDMEINPKTQDYKAITELVPIRLLVVKLPDFFLADLLTSETTNTGKILVWIVVSTIHSISLLPQFHTCLVSFSSCSSSYCLGRFYEEKDGMKGLNGVKYFITILTLLTKELEYIGMDCLCDRCSFWYLLGPSLGLGSPSKKVEEPLVDRQVLVPHKSVYFAVIVPFLHKQIVVVIIAVLEIIRRGIWNFFRLENEHLNNVGKYCAFKSVPLPFNYNEDDDKDE